MKFVAFPVERYCATCFPCRSFSVTNSWGKENQLVFHAEVLVLNNSWEKENQLVFHAEVLVLNNSWGKENQEKCPDQHYRYF